LAILRLGPGMHWRRPFDDLQQPLKPLSFEQLALTIFLKPGAIAISSRHV
jgi:hypothetical protein